MMIDFSGKQIFDDLISRQEAINAIDAIIKENDDHSGRIDFHEIKPTFGRAENKVIPRNPAKEAALKYANRADGAELAKMIVEKMPSVEFSIPESKDCINRRIVQDAIEAEAWAYCDYLIRQNKNDLQTLVCMVTDNKKERIAELPSVRSDRTKGHWEKWEYGTHRCSECDNFIDREQYQYCPYCGAEMEV